MNNLRSGIWFVCLLVFVALFASVAVAQERRLASNIIVPQRASFAAANGGKIEITQVRVGVVILEQAATTTMDISLKNPGNSRQEAQLVVPVPDGAVVRSFSFEGSSSEPTARVLPREEARRTYNAIVARIRDPALLEFVGYNLVQSSVFPVNAKSTQKVRLTYEHLLPADGNRIDYVLPRSESLEYKVPWKVSVRIKSKRPISTVYSPSHMLETTRLSEKIVSLQIAKEAIKEPGPFRLSYLLEQEGVTASLLAYPDAKAGGGYFLLLAGLPAKPLKQCGTPAIKREVTLVLDRSGSMRGEKLEQVREAAMQVLAGLEEGEAFNIIMYNNQIDFFSKNPVLKTKENLKKAYAYLKGVNASGGTNIHDAFVEALRQKPADGTLPIVLFLTDGLPTTGQTSEVAIRNVAIKGNPYKRRIFTFGAGVDVNTPLLDKIASETRATATYVLPKEDVEVKVSQVFKRLSGPVLAEPGLEIVDSEKKPAPARVRDIIPGKLPDLFEGGQLVLLGQYVGNEPLTFRLSGNYLGKKRTFEFTFSLEKATTRNSFVPRLWASRKIGVLIDAIRQLGANGSPAPASQAPSSDPKLKELVDEIVRLSIEFGILTEYTAFLALEGTNLADKDNVLKQAQGNFEKRAVATRSGMGSVNQSANIGRQVSQGQLNPTNKYQDKNMNAVTITAVQKVNDLAFYQRGKRWVDSRLVGKEDKVKPKKIIEFGSEEFRKLALKLAENGRQGSISLRGDILLIVDGEPVLVKGPAGK
jgi:Ca-activated chloride channel family protein